MRALSPILLLIDKSYLELDVEIAVLEGILEERHTLTSNCVCAVVSDVLARSSRDLKSLPIQVLHLEVNTSECFEQRHLLLNI